MPGFACCPSTNGAGRELRGTRARTRAIPSRSKNAARTRTRTRGASPGKASAIPPSLGGLRGSIRRAVLGRALQRKHGLGGGGIAHEATDVGIGIARFVQRRREPSTFDPVLISSQPGK